MVDFIRLTMPDMTPTIMRAKDILRISPRSSGTGSYVLCCNQEGFPVLETPAEIGEMLGAACPAPVVTVEKPVSLPTAPPVVPQDDGAVKGEEDAWQAFWVGKKVFRLELMEKSTIANFRAALRITIAANRQPMHFTVDDVVRIASASNKSVVAYLRSMGATVEYPDGEIR